MPCCAYQSRPIPGHSEEKAFHHYRSNIEGYASFYSLGKGRSATSGDYRMGSTRDMSEQKPGENHHTSEGVALHQPGGVEGLGGSPAGK